MGTESASIKVSDAHSVTGLWRHPAHAWACMLLAPGAGAGLQHPFLASVAEQLDGLGIATLRYQFPYMERGGKRPDRPQLCHATVRAAVGAARSAFPALPCIAGGKSFGGRMTSQTQALTALEGVRGLVFLGFPLHPPSEPADTRGQHLLEIKVPMLFLQGTRDEFADLVLLRPLVARLGQQATLKLFEGADHSFRVRDNTRGARSEIPAVIAQALAAWMRQVLS